MQITKCNQDLNLVLNPGLEISVSLNINYRNKLTDRKEERKKKSRTDETSTLPT